jgi:hypothetical protein
MSNKKAQRNFNQKLSDFAVRQYLATHVLLDNANFKRHNPSSGRSPSKRCSFINHPLRESPTNRWVLHFTYPTLCC